MVTALRKVMAEFIKADSRQVQLRRPHYSETDAGGYTITDWDTIDPQEFRLVPIKRRLTDMVRNVADGEIPNQQYVLVGLWDCDLKREDEFFLDGVYYRVLAIDSHTNARAYTDRVVGQLLMLQPEGVVWDVQP